MYIFRLIVQYFEENYFSSSLNGDYQNLNFTHTATTLLMIVGGICLGVLLASFIVVFERRVVGRFIRTLLSKGAKDAQTALTLSDLGLEKNGFIKRELSRASVSRKMISVVRGDGSVSSYQDELAASLVPEDVAPAPTPSEDGLIPEEDREGAPVPKKSAKERIAGFFFEKKFRLRPVDFATARFFIPEELGVRASLRFREKGSSPLWLVLATVLVLVLFLLCLRFIPAFVGMLDVSISNLKGE